MIYRKVDHTNALQRGRAVGLLNNECKFLNLNENALKLKGVRINDHSNSKELKASIEFMGEVNIHEILMPCHVSQQFLAFIVASADPHKRHSWIPYNSIQAYI